MKSGMMRKLLFYREFRLDRTPYIDGCQTGQEVAAKLFRNPMLENFTIRRHSPDFSIVQKLGQKLPAGFQAVVRVIYDDFGAGRVWYGSSPIQKRFHEI